MDMNAPVIIVPEECVVIYLYQLVLLETDMQRLV